MAGERSNKGEVTTEGYDYQLYTLLHCVDRLQNKKNVREYTIGNAVVGFGALDDVVFNATLEGGDVITTVIQVKHTTNPTRNTIGLQYLCQDNGTYLYKYYDSYVKMPELALKQLNQIILWTNMCLHKPIEDWFEGFVPNCDKSDILGGSTKKLSYRRYKIKQEKWEYIAVDCLINMQKKKKKQESKEKQDDPLTKKREQEEMKNLAENQYKSSKDQWEQFFDRLVFYVKAPNVTNLKTYLANNIKYFEDFRRLVEKCVIKQITTSKQINNLIALIELQKKNSMETRPYANLHFSDLNKLQRKVRNFLYDRKCRFLRVKASRNSECTVSRLVTVVEECLKPESKRYLALSYQSLINECQVLKLIASDHKLVEIGLNYLIISFITHEEIRKLENLVLNLKRTAENQASVLKIIFVQIKLETKKITKRIKKKRAKNKLAINFADQFDVSTLDDSVISCAVKHIATGYQIKKLFSLVDLRNSMKIGPCTQFIFSDLHKLQIKVKKFLKNDTYNFLRVRAIQDTNCTMARLIMTMENYLADETMNHLIFSYKTLVEKHHKLKMIACHSKLKELGVQYFIISSISRNNIRKLENQLSYTIRYSKNHLSNVKIIFVESNLNTKKSRKKKKKKKITKKKLELKFTDKFDTNNLDNHSKGMINCAIEQIMASGQIDRLFNLVNSMKKKTSKHKSNNKLEINIDDQLSVCPQDNSVINCEANQLITSDQMNRLCSLNVTPNCIETNYNNTEISQYSLNKLQRKVENLFDDETKHYLHVKASQNSDCTVVRLMNVVDKCLTPKQKRYLSLSYKTCIENCYGLLEIVKHPEFIAKGINCIIISSIAYDEINKVQKILSFERRKMEKLPSEEKGKTENYLSALKIIFVESMLDSNKTRKNYKKKKTHKIGSYFDDNFDINFLDKESKDVIRNRKIKLSEHQWATMNEIFRKELFRKNNYSMVLKLFRLPNDTIFTLDEPPPDAYYISRRVKWNPVHSNTSNVDLLKQTDFCKLIIHDQPGMGKTTEIVQLSFDFKQKYQDHLVVYFHCKAAVTRWKTNVENLLCKTIRSYSELTKCVIKKIVQLGKVILIFDGYDEVSEEYKNTLQLMLLEASKIKTFKLYIATRPHCTEEIKKIFVECGLCYLEPFDEDDQLTYLKKFWDVKNNGSQITFDENARRIINQFRTIMDGSSFIGIPLQTHMIGVIYKNRIFTSDFELSKSQSLGFIYKEFVELKFLEYAKRNFDPTNAAHAQAIKDLRESFLCSHIQAALKIHHNSSDELCVGIQNYGIVAISPTISFVHFTYLEYFLALHILTDAMDPTTMKYFIEKFVYQSVSPVCRFMNDLLDLLEPTMSELIPSDKLPVNFIPPITSRLHCSKIIEFHEALSISNLIKGYLLFSHLLSNRMFNILEIFYDSLRIEIKSQVRLCLDPFCNKHPDSICFCLNGLKNPGNLIEILNILLRKNPNTFVTLYVADQEEYLLDLMCNQAYFVLFEWFKKIFLKLHEQQRASLRSMVKRRVDMWLLKIIRNDNVELLNNTITWIKNEWPVQTINEFLTNKNLLLLFAENIEENILQFPFNNIYRKSAVTKRIEMVDSVFNLYNWAFEGKIPIDRECLNSIESIMSIPIKSAFQTTFLSK